MSARSRSGLFLLAIMAAFFASGAACLIAEVTWNRMLIVVVGNSLGAAAMIISIFMGGLGLGSFVGGRYFARRRASPISARRANNCFVCLKRKVPLDTFKISCLVVGIMTTAAPKERPSTENGTPYYKMKDLVSGINTGVDRHYPGQCRLKAAHSV